MKKFKKWISYHIRLGIFRTRNKFERKKLLLVSVGSRRKKIEVTNFTKRSSYNNASYPRIPASWFFVARSHTVIVSTSKSALQRYRTTWPMAVLKWLNITVWLWFTRCIYLYLHFHAPKGFGILSDSLVTWRNSPMPFPLYFSLQHRRPRKVAYRAVLAAQPPAGHTNETQFLIQSRTTW